MENNDKFWAHCPPELLLVIFRKLDNRSLISCMCVNSQWMSIAKCVIEDIGYETFAKRTLNKYTNVKRKSTLNWEDLIFNYALWLVVNSSKIEKLHEYDINANDIITINVFEDNLIIHSASTVKYFSVLKHELTRENDFPCLYFEETEHLFAEVCSDGIGKQLIAVGKSSDSDILDYPAIINIKMSDTSLSVKNNINCFLVKEDHILFFCSKGGLWDLKWHDDKWRMSFVARFYGDSSCISTMHTYNDQIYALCYWGSVYFTKIGLFHFKKLCDFDLPKYSSQMVPVFFDKHSLIVGVPSSLEPKCRIKNALDSYQVLLERPGMTCAKTHGDMLLMGYCDGKVEICVQDKLVMNEEPELRFNLQNYTTSRRDHLSVIGLDVYEAQGCHHLFVATKYKVYQMLLTSNYFNIRS